VASLSDHLFEVVRKGFVRPARAPAGEEAFRFHHVLVRDVAYNGLSKADRARLHERHADWLDGEPDALDEIVGYHLEQAYRYRAELGPPNRRARQLAADAGARLGAAGMRSWRGGDVPATINLLGRATSLLPENEPWRRELLCELGVAYDAAGDTARAEETLSGAVTSAEAAMDARSGLRARLDLALVAKSPDVLEVAAECMPVFEAVGDDRSLGRAWLATGWVKGGRLCRNAEWEYAAEQALVHYRHVGFPAATCLGQIAAALYYGPTPVETAVDRCESLLNDEDAGQSGRARVLGYLAGLEAMRTHFDEARRLLGEAHDILDDLGQTAAAATYAATVRGDVELLAGDAQAAVAEFRKLCAIFTEQQNWGALSTSAADLAWALSEVDSCDAEEWTHTSERHAARDDVGAQFSWRAARARVLARRGAFEEAEPLARGAVALAEQTDALNKRAAVLLSLAEVLHLNGDDREANEAAAQALWLYELKGNLVAAERARANSKVRGPSRSLSP
jgi:tetratricopeptide (TPR) repeat protein